MTFDLGATLSLPASATAARAAISTPRLRSALYRSTCAGSSARRARISARRAGRAARSMRPALHCGPAAGVDCAGVDAWFALLEAGTVDGGWLDFAAGPGPSFGAGMGSCGGIGTAERGR